MFGTGSTFSNFSSDAVLPMNTSSATSGGELINAMKENGVIVCLAGFTRHRHCNARFARINA